MSHSYCMVHWLRYCGEDDIMLCYYIITSNSIVNVMCTYIHLLATCDNEVELQQLLLFLKF